MFDKGIRSLSLLKQDRQANSLSSPHESTHQSLREPQPWSFDDSGLLWAHLLSRLPSNFRTSRHCALFCRFPLRFSLPLYMLSSLFPPSACRHHANPVTYASRRATLSTI